MSDKVVHMCSYYVPQPFRQRRFCLNRAKWYVEYREADAPGMDRLRQKVRETRCSQHTASKFFPKGATQITTQAIDDPRAVSPNSEDAAE